MTAAERQQRRRQRLNRYLSHRLPWDDKAIADRLQSDFLDDLYRWMEGGDTKEIASWLAFCVSDSGRWDEIDTLVRAELQAKGESRIP